MPKFLKTRSDDDFTSSAELSPKTPSLTRDYARKTPLAARGFNVPDFQTGLVTIVGSARVRTVKSDREENARGAEAEDPLLICIVNSDEGGVAGWEGEGGGRKGLKNRVAAAVSCEKKEREEKMHRILPGASSVRKKRDREKRTRRRSGGTQH